MSIKNLNIDSTRLIKSFNSFTLEDGDVITTSFNKSATVRIFNKTIFLLKNCDDIGFVRGGELGEFITEEYPCKLDISRVVRFENNIHFPKNPQCVEYITYETEMMRCREDIIYFSDKYIKILSHGQMRLIKLFLPQEDALDIIQGNGKNISKSCRRGGKTILSAILAVHEAVTKRGSSTLLRVNNQSSGEYIHDVIVRMLIELPEWMSTVTIHLTHPTHVIQLSNGSRIDIAHKFTEYFLCGKRYTLMVCDELSASDPLTQLDIIETFEYYHNSQGSKIVMFFTKKKFGDVDHPSELWDSACPKGRFNFERPNSSNWSRICIKSSDFYEPPRPDED